MTGLGGWIVRTARMEARAVLKWGRVRDTQDEGEVLVLAKHPKRQRDPDIMAKGVAVATSQTGANGLGVAGCV